MLTAALSVYIVWEAARIGLPHATVTRMVSNLVLDTVLGSLPIAGDFFDATWKANSKNIALLEAHLDAPKSHKKANPAFVLLLLVGFLVLAIALAAFTAFLIASIWHAVVK
jgi:hypothetical protein